MIQPRTPRSSRSFETLFRLGNVGNVDDGQLLERFKTCNDARGAEAFRVLIERYGPIVMGVCRGVLGDMNHADDAFQATFLVLIRKAGSIRNGQSIGPWLHGVALRVARRARAQAARRSALEKPLEEAVSSAMAAGHAEPEEWIETLHEEIDRLPENLRNPLVLCCLEELSYEQAARRLGVNEPTLRGRLYRGRQRLEARLRARGVSLGATLPLGISSGRLLAPVSQLLAEATVQLASKWYTLGILVIAAGSPAAQRLAQGVIRTMIWKSIRLATIPMVVAASVLGTAVVAQQGRDSSQAPGAAGAQVAPSKGAAVEASSPEKKQSDEVKWKHELEQRIRLDLEQGIQLKLEQGILEQGITRELELRTKELEKLLLQAQASQKQQELQKKTAHIRELLAGETNLNFPKGVSLEEFLKAVKSSTSNNDYHGIPIYVDPKGLQEVEKTMESQVVVKPFDKLGDVLQKALRSVNLGYVVDDGFLCINSRLGTVESRLTSVEEKLDRIVKALESKGPHP